MRRIGIGKMGWAALVLMMAAGAVTFLTVVVTGVLSGQGNLTRSEAPGEHEVTLSRAGEYTLFLEYSRTVDSLRVNRPRGLDDLQVALTTPAGTEVPLEVAPSGKYAIRRLVGEAFRQFHIDETGTYKLRAFYPSGEGPAVQLALKRSYQDQVLESLARGFAVLIATIIAVATTLWWLNRRAQQSNDAEFAL